MKNVSSTFKSLAENPNGARYYLKILDNGTEIDTENIDDFVYSGMINSDDGFTFGTACSSMVSFSMFKPTVNLGGKELEILQGIDTGNGIEYVRLGYFTVLKPTKDREITYYECVDRMTSRMDMPYFSELNYPNTDINVLKEICEQTGIKLANADNSLKSHAISSVPNGYTRREIIAYMSALQGRNAMINDEGNLILVWYSDSGFVVDDDKIYYEGTSNVNDETNYTLGYIECTVNSTDGTESTTLRTGSGSTGVIIENPFMTQDILDEIYEVIGGFSFRTVEVEFLGDFRLELGDIVKVETNGETYSVPIMQLEQKSDGGVVTTIQSVAETDTENGLDLSGPNRRQMERYYAELVMINQAMINKLSVGEADIRYLRSDYVDIITANITEAVIGNLSAEVATISYLEANYAQINFANVEKATIGTVLADVGLITEAVIVDGHVTGFLDSVNIDANYITAGTLEVERLIIRGSTNSLVYELNNITGALQSQNVDTLNGEILTPRTITADRIVAQSITANEIAASAITADKIVSKAITADKLNVSSLSAIAANLGTVTAGIIQSTNYVANSTGMQLNLANGVWDSKYFKIASDGSVTASYGTVGGWSLTSSELLSTSTSLVHRIDATISDYSSFENTTSAASSYNAYEQVKLNTGAETNIRFLRLYNSLRPQSGIEINQSGIYALTWSADSTTATVTSNTLMKFSAASQAIEFSRMSSSRADIYNIYSRLIHVNTVTAESVSATSSITAGSTITAPYLRIGYTNSTYAASVASFICNSWIRTVGNTGWFNETHGGGWYMTDSTWIRNNGSKQVYLNALLRVDANVQFGSSGSYYVNSSGNGYLNALNVAGTLTLTNTTDLSATSYTGPALVVGGTSTTAHLEVDANEICAKSNASTLTNLSINDGKLEVTGDGINVRGRFELYNSTPYIDFHFANSTDDYTARIIESSSGTLRAYNSISNASDRTLKKDIRPLPEVYLQILDGLKPMQYRFIKGDEYLNLGFVAQDIVQTFLENNFAESTMPLVSKDDDGIYALDYNGIIAMLVLGYQHQKQEIEQLKLLILDLQSRLAKAV